MGRIVEVLKSADHEIRAAKVRLPSSKILTRPLSKLYPFSTSSPTEEPQTEKKGDPPSGNTVAETISASVRVCIPPLKFYLQMMLVLCLVMGSFCSPSRGSQCEPETARNWLLIQHLPSGHFCGHMIRCSSRFCEQNDCHENGTMTCHMSRTGIWAAHRKTEKRRWTVPSSDSNEWLLFTTIDDTYFDFLESDSAGA
ncbi:hypothetical protein QR680_011488 [Steinernema hermaphroditum]|uniref:Uncharacterized protein n=1 Tax=Steinernema hermaphroditum TaxID=289476 RepID=A0AA39HYP2_9BILA|nr:hypothetical protein QR680_011488 [Steinernema hermaphroditum]